ncbi:hypothetical protein BSF_27520 [Bacillus subtilis]|nr:hypothetical protein BSF_27520 [Bacillus subtilis]
MFSDDFKKTVSHETVYRKNDKMKWERTGDTDDSINDHDAGKGRDYCYIGIYSGPH